MFRFAVSGIGGVARRWHLRFPVDEGYATLNAATANMKGVAIGAAVMSIINNITATTTAFCGCADGRNTNIAQKPRLLLVILRYVLRRGGM